MFDLVDKDMFIRVGDASRDRIRLESEALWTLGRDRMSRERGITARFGRLVSEDSGGGERSGENSGGGYIGSIVDVNGTGDPGRVEKYGGGVVDVARGLGWLDAVGEAPGDEYRGEE